MSEKFRYRYWGDDRWYEVDSMADVGIDEDIIWDGQIEASNEPSSSETSNNKISRWLDVTFNFLFALCLMAMLAAYATPPQSWISVSLLSWMIDNPDASITQGIIDEIEGHL